MKNITTKQFNIFSDYMDIYQFMLDIYDTNWCNGVPAPFIEYAYHSFSYWMDLSYTYKNRIWMDNNEIVAFCFTENPVTDIYFSLKPGYEDLASEIIAYADKSMPHLNDNFQFILFKGQEALISAAKTAGYKQVGKFVNLGYNFKKPLDFPLPEDFHFVNPCEHDMAKISECCYKGFDHEKTEGPWNNKYIQNTCMLQSAPHATPQYNVVIANNSGDYVCYAGMWWIPENHLAYMEPLCTIPEYRHKGLALAALSKLIHDMKVLGATHLTGGENEFYQKAGFTPAQTWTFWKK